MKTSMSIVTAIGLLLGAAAPAWADTGYSMGHNWGGGYGHMMFGGLTMILVIAAAVLLVVLAVRWIASSGGPPPSVGRASEILDERFARGEIDRDEYLQRKQDLTA